MKKISKKKKKMIKNAAIVSGGIIGTVLVYNALKKRGYGFKSFTKMFSTYPPRAGQLRKIIRPKSGPLVSTYAIELPIIDY